VSVADRIGREAQEFLALKDADYSVRTEHASSFSWFYVRVFYRDQLIYSKACCRSYRVARGRVRRAVRDHKRFIAGVRKEGVRV
jgi:hypothetical protein